MVWTTPAAVCPAGNSKGGITDVNASGVKCPDSTGLCGEAQKKFHSLQQH